MTISLVVIEFLVTFTLFLFIAIGVITMAYSQSQRELKQEGDMEQYEDNKTWMRQTVTTAIKLLLVLYVVVIISSYIIFHVIIKI